MDEQPSDSVELPDHSLFAIEQLNHVQSLNSTRENRNHNLMQSSASDQGQRDYLYFRSQL